MIFRPATPGFLVTLAATIMLAAVTFSVPMLKSVFFLKAVVDFKGQHGTVSFGVLGYCLETGGNVNCSTPRIGYEFDPNSLLDNKTPIKIPEILVKWLTYALVLHVVALVCAAGSAIFGLLAHVREMSMTCFSSCISGLGAAVALLAFIFDVAFFFIVKARINAIPGGSAQIGIGVWLTLAAWICLFFAGCFFGFGRCCISRRPRGPRDSKMDPPFLGNGLAGNNSEAMRLDAVKAEADRKARQKQMEVGLPAFQEYDPSRPLTAKYEDEEESYSDNQPPRRQPSGYTDNHTPSRPGYVPAAPGTSAMDAYSNAPVPSTSPQPKLSVSTYPPPPQSYPQPPPAVAGYSQQQSPTQYSPAQYDPYGNHNSNQGYASNQGQYLSAAPYGAYGHNQYPSNATHESNYGHHAQDTSYYSATSHYQQPSYNPDPSYNNGGYVPSASSVYSSTTLAPSVVPSSRKSPVPSNPSPQQFTATGAPGSMGRDDYSFDSKSPPQPVGAAADTSYLAFAGSSSQNSHQNAGPTSRGYGVGPRGPRSPTSPTSPSHNTRSDHHEDSPPGYESGHGHATTAWPNEKR